MTQLDELSILSHNPSMREEVKKNLPLDIPCPYCGGGSVLAYAAPDFNRRVSNIVFHMNNCTSCGLLFLTDKPKDLGPYYQQGYHTPASLEMIDTALSGEKYKIDIVQKFHPHKQNARLLEIGPSVGYFCRLAQKSGFDVAAIEYDLDCADFLNNTMKVNTTQTFDPAQALEADGKKYDVICLWHSIEHLPHPWLVVKNAYDKLNAGGHLIIATPNPSSWQLSFMKSRWPHLDFPRHLFLLPSSWLEKLAYSLGMRPLLITTRDPGSLFWERFTWAMFLARPDTSRWYKKRWWQCALMIGRIIQFFQRHEGRGACYTMVLHKEDV